MVLWELTAITAYFLGLRRTYRLALRIQRRLIPPNHPRIRDFVYRYCLRRAPLPCVRAQDAVDSDSIRVWGRGRLDSMVNIQPRKGRGGEVDS
jgi:hypothetical protein